MPVSRALQRRRAEVALGWRLAHFRGYVPAVRALLVAVAASAMTIFSLAAVAALAVADAQTATTSARSVDLHADGTPRFEAIDPRLLPDRLWGGHRIDRQFVASADPSNAPVPPGVSQFPGAGTMYVSPGLRDLIDTDRVVQALFADYRIVGTIGPAGLTGPEELRAVVGVPSNAGYLSPAGGFGSDDAKATEDASVNLFVAVFLTILIAIPAVALLVMSVRMSSDERGRRRIALTQIGVSRLRVAGLMSLETILPVAAGSVLGVVAFSIARESWAHVPLTNVSFYPSDARAPLWALVVLPTMILIAALVIALWQARTPSQSTRPALQASRPSRLRVLPIIVGLAGMALWLAVGRTSSALAAYGYWILLLILAAGIVISGPVLVRFLAQVLQPKSGVGTSVGLALAATRTTATTHLAGVVAVTLLAIGTTTPFVNILNGGKEDRAAAVLADARGVSLVIPQAGDLISAAEAGRWEGVLQALPSAFVETSARTQVGLVLGSCADIQDLSEARVHECTTSPVWLAADATGTGPLPASAHILAAGEGPSIDLPPPHKTLVVPGLSQDLVGYLLVPMGTIEQDVIEPDQRQLILQVNEDKVASVIARVASSLPSSTVRAGEYAYRDSDQAQFPDQVQWLRFGSIICGILGALALAMSGLGDAAPRRRHLVGLLRMGPPRRAILAAHVAATGLPLAVLAVLGTAAGWLSFHALAALDDRAFAPPAFYLKLLVAGLAVASIVVTASAPPIMRRLARDEIANLRA